MGQYVPALIGSPHALTGFLVLSSRFRTMTVYNVSANRSLYKTLESLAGGDISLLARGWTFPGASEKSPLLTSQNIASDGKRFLRISLSSRETKNGEGSASKPFVTLDIDCRCRLAWIVTDQKSPFMTPERGVQSKQERALWFLAKHLSPYLKVLKEAEVAAEKTSRQQTAAKKRSRQRYLAETFNLPPGHRAKVQATKRRIQDERKQQIRGDAQDGLKETPSYVRDMLHRKTLYQRLTSMFGDLESVRGGLVLDGEQTSNPYARGLLFVQGRRVENRGLFELYTTSPGSSKSRTLVAMFLVDFVAMQAQATPALELFKGAYTLALRAPEHIRQVNLNSQLGALLPLGIQDPVAREKAYRTMLPTIGVSSERFYAVSSRFLSPGNRLGLYCNLAADGMLQQAERAGYALQRGREFTGVQERSRQFQFESLQRDGSNEAVTVRFADGSEETLVVTGVEKGRSTQEVLDEYVRQQLAKRAEPHQMAQNGNRSHGLQHSR